jgi:hypothetical protein
MPKCIQSDTISQERSRRHLSANDARRMVAVREARRLYRENQTLCFWWARPDLIIRAADVPWVADGLRKHGGRQAWREAARLERLLGTVAAIESERLLPRVGQCGNDVPSGDHGHRA